jgi:hypothetical protein
MDPITSTDRITALLRQHLRERAKTTRPGKDRARSVITAGSSPFAALAALDDLDRRQLRRACIQALLADQLGPEFLNDAQFQQVVGRVSDLIAEDGDASRLLDRVLDDLRRS